MRKSARNRIIIWSIVSVVLIGMLAVGIHTFSKYSIYKNLPFLNNVNLVGLNENDSDDYTTSAGESLVFTSEQVDSIDIDWISGDVEVLWGDTDKITVEETSSQEITEENAMRYSLDGSTLKISAGRDYALFSLFSFGKSGISKNLTVTIPRNKSLNTLDIDSASADINIDGGAKINEVKADTASGCIGIYDATGIKAKANTASGKIVIDGSFESIDTETVSGQTEITSNCHELDMSSVSGDIKATLGKELSSADTKTVSGAISIVLPKDVSGFTAKYETVSGDFSSNFEGQSGGKSFVSGDGSAELDFETVSGSITINN